MTVVSSTYELLSAEEVAEILQIRPSQVLKLFKLRTLKEALLVRPFWMYRKDLEIAMKEGIQLPLPIHNF